MGILFQGSVAEMTGLGLCLSWQKQSPESYSLDYSVGGRCCIMTNIQALNFLYYLRFLSLLDQPQP